MRHPFSRAQRRHDDKRIRAKRVQRVQRVQRYGHWYPWRELTPTIKGRLTHTGTSCSCAMCGNPRRYENAITRQEQWAIQEAKADPSLE